jgi:hypothetical protein
MSSEERMAYGTGKRTRNITIHYNMSQHDRERVCCVMREMAHLCVQWRPLRSGEVQLIQVCDWDGAMYVCMYVWGSAALSTALVGWLYINLNIFHIENVYRFLFDSFQCMHDSE